MKIVHDKYNKRPDQLEAFMSEFHEAVKNNDQLRPHLAKVMEDMNPIRVLGLLERISKEDCDLLDIHGRCGQVQAAMSVWALTRAFLCRPESMVITHLAVPPVCIRPSVEMESASGSNEDDLTMKLMQIIEARCPRVLCGRYRRPL